MHEETQTCPRGDGGTLYARRDWLTCSVCAASYTQEHVQAIREHARIVREQREMNVRIHHAVMNDLPHNDLYAEACALDDALYIIENACLARGWGWTG